MEITNHPILAFFSPAKSNVAKTFNVQKERLPLALKELETHNKKKGHWAWYAFPTARPGGNDPKKVKIVGYEEQAKLLELCRAESDIWKRVLEKIKELVQSKGKRILPKIDHGRVHFFCLEWKRASKDPNYAWLADVINVLEPHYTM